MPEREGAARPPVIMVHGGFSGGWCFDDFRIPFEAAGYAVDAPDLPGHAPEDGPGAVVGRSMRHYARAVAGRIREAAAPPILVGHSMGGLVCQLAAQLAPVAALVLLAPSPPWGQAVSGLVETASAFALWSRGLYFTEAVAPDWQVVRSVTLDRLSEPEARAIYARMVPESGWALFETLNWWLDPLMTTLVSPLEPQPPTLAVTGELDRIHPPATVRLSAGRIGAEFREAPGMSHWTLGEPGWEGVAAQALAWLETARERVPAAV